MAMESSKIIEILLREHYVSEDDMARAKEYIKTHNVLLADYLLSEGILTKDLLGQAVAEALDVVYADLNTHKATKEAILKIPEVIAKEFRVVLFAEDEKNVTITTDDPTKEGLSLKLKELFPNKNIIIAYSLSEDIEVSFLLYRKSLETRFAKIIQEKKKVAPEIIDEMIEDALYHKASDIHFEPRENEILIRFRVDGVLQEAGIIPKDNFENILNRIKVQARLRIDEHNAAQDGSIRYISKNGTKVDLRVSLVPTLNGEKIVIRLLAEYVKDLGLNSLGLSATNQSMLATAAKKPFGMILVAGPTGSGKTTTLYALLKSINKPEINITTIEDPAEYKLPGINQIQINNQTNLTFAKGLRSIIRQDPDVIFVGEIRDEETAEIAVNAALTGHLLLSTFHANDAATAIPRLLDMGVEPFLLASTLELLIAQRLVRKICERCRVSIKADDPSIKDILASLEPKFSAQLNTFYRGKGCHICGGTGYHGRTAIYEFISISPAMENLILSNPSKQEIWKLASQEGSATMFEDGLSKIKSGMTTLDELLRVTLPPDK
ncbi:type II/IV secretion system protein [Candidatus Parcubacteria bacterium]|nr:MAG: type II/IV secretion system protein [Candidatus Parcubacteria bacterium]